MPGPISYEYPEAGEPRSSSDGKIRTALVKLKEAINGGINNENLSGNAGITRANLASESKPVTWYTPKVIATEETRENAAFGTLATADEVKSVVLPTNGLIVVGYNARVKSSVAEAGKIAIFIGANQLKERNAAQEASCGGINEFRNVYTVGGGLRQAFTATSASTTGEAIAAETTLGPFCAVFAAAGAYNISVQFRATSGSVTAKERKLWVYTLGF